MEEIEGAMRLSLASQRVQLMSHAENAVEDGWFQRQQEGLGTSPDSICWGRTWERRELHNQAFFTSLGSASNCSRKHFVKYETPPKPTAYAISDTVPAFFFSNSMARCKRI